MDDPDVRLVVREDKQWEKYVMAELLIPDVVNNWGDIYTRESIRRFAEAYAEKGYGMDINHDNEDVNKTKCYVVESFIARAGDPDFVEGSWVLGVKVIDDDLWNDILDGTINGFSYEAMVKATAVTFEGLENVQVFGTTEPHPIDGHTHDYLILLDLFNNPLEGATSETDGHSHRITAHTVTEVDSGHNHRFQVMVK